MFDRRLFLGLGLPLFGLMNSALAANNETHSQTIPNGWDFAPSLPLTGQAADQPTGIGPARNEEVTTAFRLLFKSPREVPPIQVAQYFEGLREKNANGYPYNWEWPTPGPANPLIVGFFSMTNTLPSEGDQTSWCAAFVNFCLAVSGKKFTGSALSGSFRTYGNQTTDPKPGDIVVFKNAGARGEQGFGHVGFFVSRSDQSVEVLGGNQRGSTGSTGAVTRTIFPFSSSSLILHSYRSVT
jgi:uncharacterized protein (TIGR02594 family)